MVEKTRKPIIPRVACSIAIVSLLIVLFALPVLAFTTGERQSNLTTGRVTAPFMNINTLEYITILTSGTALWKSIPLQSTYNVSGLANYGGADLPLANPVSSQVIYTGEVTQSFAPISITSVPYRFDDLDVAFAPYQDGEIDVTITNILSKRDADNNAFNYQVAVARFDDIYLSNDMAWGNIAEPYTKLSLYEPTFTLFTTTAFTGVSIGIEGYIQYYDSTGALQVYAFDRAFTTTTGSTLQGGVYYGQIKPVRAVLNYLTADNPIDYRTSQNYCIRDLKVTIGNTSGEVPKAITNGMRDGGVYGVSIYQPSLRPTGIPTGSGAFREDINYGLKYDWSKTTSYVEELDVSPFGSFISNVTGGFMSIQIYPGLTLGGILFTILAVAITIAVLKFFAGG